MDSESAGLAAYRKVAERIKSEIRSGIRKPGDQLPSNRKLADELNVSLGTAQKALQLLQQDGWVITTPAVGVFIADKQPAESVNPVDELRAGVLELRQIVDELSSRIDRLEGNQANK